MDPLRLAAALLVAVAACGTDPAAPTPAPIDGTWTLTRTVTVQPTTPAGCPVMSGSGGRVAFAVGTAPPISLPDDPLFDPALYGPVVDETSATFTMQVFNVLGGEPSTPVLVGHTVHVDGDALAGDGVASGDGPWLGCRWRMVVTGTRAP